MTKPMEPKNFLEVSDVANAAMDEVDRLRRIIRSLLTNPHIDLDDMVYAVRKNEGLGWDGPSVKAWSDAVQKAKEVLNDE